ncbi:MULTISPECIES: DUF3842 family protein [unclassified Sporolactobacillus]|uniref:DUF3842 family protein n=1 Tax=unclassified Sporolactobacillus TaxID=2628533 RepID=UPI002367A2A4|nr:DUF3842 family protein [Sporolactobacillus sp. CQH2019]MDD9150370.1 DUF3842 family protein [Sporolactobacillus sp. CQH2019]
MKIAVFDGQGAGLGQTVVKKLRQAFPHGLYIVALGTNTFATTKMVRAGSDIGISGERGFCSFCRRESIDCIIAPIGIIQPGSIQGEITGNMVRSFSNLTCKKFLLPLHHPNISIPCTADVPIKDYIDAIVKEIKCRMQSNRHPQ